MVVSRHPLWQKKTTKRRELGGDIYKLGLSRAVPSDSNLAIQHLEPLALLIFSRFQNPREMPKQGKYAACTDTSSRKRVVGGGGWAAARGSGGWRREAGQIERCENDTFQQVCSDTNELGA